MYRDTNTDVFWLLSQASLNVSNGDQSAQTAYALSYPTAVVHTNWPSTSALKIPKAEGWNRACLRFLLKDLAGDSVDGFTSYFRLWGRQGGYSAARLLLDLGPGLVCGSAVIGTATAPGSAPVKKDNADNAVVWTGQWGYVDDITITTNRCYAYLDPTTADNGIAEIYFDLRGIMDLYGDWDTDAGAGTTPDDAMAIIRGEG